MIAQWAYAEVVAPNAPGLFGNRWIFWVKLPSLIKANAEKVWETIEDLIRKENPTIGDMTGFPRYLDTRLAEGQIDRSPDHVSKEGHEVWAMYRPKLS
ncbi:MAG TPA: hypothetical protein VN857_18950 [Chthoniobacterales bacterium]|jgi:hypothetical protein|nr:hypothetical protein [Chthoniobacterales bacterium]